MNRHEFKSSWKVLIILEEYIRNIPIFWWRKNRLDTVRKHSEDFTCMCENLPRALHPPSNLTCTGSQHFAYSSVVLLIPSPPININSGLSWTSWIFAACRWWCWHLYMEYNMHGCLAFAASPSRSQPRSRYCTLAPAVGEYARHRWRVATGATGCTWTSLTSPGQPSPPEENARVMTSPPQRDMEELMLMMWVPF
jgi:hypothetical protein